MDYATNAWDYVIERDREFNDWDTQDELERRRMRRQQEKEWLEKEEAEERAERLERIKERMKERQYEREEKAKDREALNRVQFDIGPNIAHAFTTETSEEGAAPQKTERPFATESTPHEFRALWFIAGVSIVLAFAKGATD